MNTEKKQFVRKERHKHKHEKDRENGLSSNRIFLGMGLAVICFTLFFAAISVVSAAEDYYVATWGNDRNNGTSLGEAWQHPSYAAQQAQAGDTVLIVDGTYSDKTTIAFANSGTSEFPIIFRAYNGTPILDGIDGLANYEIGILLNDKDYIRIEGPFELINWYHSVYLYWDSDNNYIGNIISTPGGIGLSAFCDDNIIDNCIVHDTPWNAIASYGWASDQTIPRWNKNNTIQNCTVYNGGHNNIDLHSYNDGAKVIGNHVYNSNIIGIYLHNAGTLNSIIKDNIIHDNNGNGIEVCGKVENCVFENNTIYHNGGFSPPGPGGRAAGIFLQEDSWSVTHPAFNTFRNNKIYNNDGRGMVVSEKAHDNLFVNNYVDDYDPEKSNFGDYLFEAAGANNIISNEQNSITRIGLRYMTSTVTFEYTDDRIFSVDGSGEYTTYTWSSGGHTFEVVGSTTVGKISGTVTDTSVNPIEGATVTVEGTTLKDETDTNREYTITDVPVGSDYTVTASADTYESQSITGVHVLEGEITENVDFTLTKETTPPTITDQSPQDGATDVSINTTITVIFSEAMNKTSTENAFSTSPSVTGGSFSWDENEMTFTPTSDLSYGTAYTVTIDTNAHDLAGNSLDGDGDGIPEGSSTDDYIWTFTTKEQDLTPPADVNDLAASNPTSNSITLTWTAPGDDGTTGTASEYDVRYSTSIIDTEAKFNSATEATGELAPQAAGTSETFVVTGLYPSTTYYFALKTADEVPNWSGISNSPNGTTLSGPPPSWAVGSGGESWSGNVAHDNTMQEYGNDYIILSNSAPQIFKSFTLNADYTAGGISSFRHPFTNELVSGSLVRVEFEASAAGGTLSLASVSVAETDPADDRDTVDSTWELLTFNSGANDVDIPQGETAWTDWSVFDSANHKITVTHLFDDADDNSFRVLSGGHLKYLATDISNLKDWSSESPSSDSNLIAIKTVQVADYKTSGRLTSIGKDAEEVGGAGKVWKQISTNVNIPDNTEVDIYVATSQDNGVSDPWSDWTLVMDNAVSGATYDLPSGNQERYAKFKLVLNTSGASVTPEIVSITMTPSASADTTLPTTNATIIPAPNDEGWNNVTPVVVTFFRSSNDSGISYTNYSKTSETGPWTTVDTATATGPDAENVAAISESGFNVIVSDEGTTQIWYYSVDSDSNVETTKKVTVKIGTTATGIISGIVTNTTGATIQGATVTVEGTVKSGETDANGVYALTDVPINTYTVTCTAPDYQDSYKSNIAVSEGETTTVIFALISSAITPLGDLVGEWHFEEGTEGMAVDSSGNENNGIIYGANMAVGKIGSALEFDGLADYVSIPNSPSLNPANEITLLAWVNPGVIQQEGYRKIIAKPYTNSSYPWQQYALTLHDNQFVFELNTEGTKDVIASTETVEPNTWYHVTGTYDGSEMRIYVNAALNGTIQKSGAIAAYPTDVHIGAGIYSDAKREYINGTVDEVKIYNRALSVDEIQADYEVVSPVGLWHFDKGAGGVAVDSSGNENNGIIYGANMAVGKIGSALEFDGVDDYVSIPNSPSLNPANEITLLAWVNPGVIQQEGYRKIIAKPYTNSAFPWQQYALTLHDNQFVFELNTEGTKDVIASTETVEPNTWYHVTGTYDGSEMRIYVNAALKGTIQKSGAIAAYPTDVHIGAGIYSDAKREYINGTVDEVKIYNCALSVDEIQADYEEGLNGAANTLSGTITSLNSTGLVDATVTLATMEGDVINSTLTDNTGNYEFTDVSPSDYNITATKPRFWYNYSVITVNANVPATADLLLYMKGDFNINGDQADAGDLVMMEDAKEAGTSDVTYDLNGDGNLADEDDLTLLKNVSVGEAVLE